MINTTSSWLTLVTVFLCLTAGCATQSKNPAGAAPTPEPPLAQIETYNVDGADSNLTEEEQALFNDDLDAWEDEDDQEIALVSDPIEPFNRAMFTFNDKLYVWLIKPVTLGYRAVAPETVRVGVGNFFTNLSAPIRFTNCLLQGKGTAAAAEFSKFLFNSTFGVLGFGDLFKKFPEMYPDSEDLGQTLGSYGIGDGFYIVWPILGSSTFRDTVGMSGDTFLNPITYLDSQEAVYALRAADRVNTLSFRIEDIDAAKKAAFDPYEATRDFYIQLRQSKINK